MEKVGVRALITGVLDELLALATAQGCTFPADFKETTIRQMTQPQETNSTMWMDFEAKRPMEIQTYLGSPIKPALEAKVAVPRIETLYATLHHLNIVNRSRPAAGPTPTPAQNMQHPPPPPRLSSAPLPRGPPGPNGPGPMMNGNGPMKGGPRPGSRAPSITGVPPMMRRGPPPGMNGYPPRMNGAPNGQRRPSLKANELEGFSHLMLYDDMMEGAAQGAPGAGPYDNGAASSGNLSLRERELMIRQREIQLREQELNMRRGPTGQGRRAPPPQSVNGLDDDDDEDDFFDPMAGGRQPGPMIDPDNFDMMSVTSRRNRKVPSAGQIRNNPEGMGYIPGPQGRSRNPFGRPGMKQNRNSSQRLMSDIPGLHSSIMNDPLLGYSSNRYADVDRGAMGAQSRTNSLTASRLDEMQGGGNYGGYPSMSRRTSQSPGNPLSPGSRPNGRPSPPNGYAPNGMPPNGMPPRGPNGRPSPPGMRQPLAPQQV